MKNPFDLVLPGDKVGQQSAQRENMTTDAIQYVREKKASQRKADPLTVGMEYGQAWVLNECGSDCLGGEVLGLDDNAITEAQNLLAFQKYGIRSGKTPDIDKHLGKFAVLIEPIKNNELGKAWVSGSFCAYVNIVDIEHEFVDIADGKTDYLESCSSSDVKITSPITATGEQWAWVRFGGSGGSGIELAKIVSGQGYGYEVEIVPGGEHILNVYIPAGVILTSNVYVGVVKGKITIQSTLFNGWGWVLDPYYALYNCTQ